jgi:cytosine/adenosine deaminase-related metal-dependent hydrolase
MPPPDITVRARYVFPVDAPPLESAAVRIAGDRIVQIESGPAGPGVLDLGNAAILPGFVNAHTHLELSALRAKGFAASSFVDWLTRVIATRSGQTATQITHAVRRGIDASLSSGTTLVGDVSTSGRSWKELSRSPLRAVVFAEMLGLKEQRAAQTADAARQFLEWAGDPADPVLASTDDTIPDFADFDNDNDDNDDDDDFRKLEAIPELPKTKPASPLQRLTPSVSPHAPYSTQSALYDVAARWAVLSGAPLCTHLAETPEELRLLQSHDGPLRGFLHSIGAWHDEWKPAGPRPSDYVTGAESSQAHWLMAHGNYFGSDEIAKLAEPMRSGGPRRSIAFCPRTHAYFGHRPHPYREMLAAGLNVCLGTDSLASTATLSMLDEMRFLHRRDRTLPGATILEMATLAGARALERSETTGSLAPGKFADIAVVRLPDREATDPHELLLDSTGPVIRTMIAGKFVYQRLE